MSRDFLGRKAKLYWWVKNTLTSGKHTDTGPSQTPKALSSSARVNVWPVSRPLDHRVVLKGFECDSWKESGH